MESTSKINDIEKEQYETDDAIILSIIKKETPKATTELDCYTKKNNKTPVIKCAFGASCLDLKNSGTCQYLHSSSELPCFIEKNYNICKKPDCKFRHKEIMTNKYMDLVVRDQHRDQHRDHPRSSRAHSRDHSRDRSRSSRAHPRDHSRDHPRDSLWFQMKKLTEDELKFLLETPLKVVEYGNETLFMVNNKLYKDLLEVSNIRNLN
jgi:hypothetical protein